MKKNIFKLKNSFPKEIFNNLEYKKLSNNFDQIFEGIQEDKNKFMNTMNLFHKKYVFNFTIKDLKKFKKFKRIAIIGMGGSILGAEAIYELLSNKIQKEVHFFDDLSNKDILKFKKNRKLQNILFLIISKSGNTLETLTNTIILDVLKKNKKNIIIISEKNNNILHSLSKKLGVFFIEHKKNIGGRYSVLTEVGLVPAYLMGLNILNLRKNINRFFQNNAKSILKENSLKLASLSESKKYSNFIMLNYAPELEKFLYWCQQLIGESLGKKGKGFLPVVSNVPKDHHSLLQLYLDGPKDKIFNIFSIIESTKLIIKSNKIESLNFLNKKSLSKIKDAQKDALIEIFTKNKIPFREFIISGNDEKILGELFSYFILETVCIAKLIGVNPFNQPAIEQTKTLTKKNLAKSTNKNF